MKKILLSVLAMTAMMTLAPTTAYADYYTTPQTLKYGMSSTEVKNLQEDLKLIGYFTGTPLGNFGLLTKDAVVRFQKAHNLTPDGVVGPRTAREIKISDIIHTAKALLDTPYLLGGTTPAAFDCSGFMMYITKLHDINILRTSALQYTMGTPVDKTQLQRGDFIFFNTNGDGHTVTHVGMFIGNGQFIHASSGAGKVIISYLSNSYYTQHYVGAKRII